jgi:hypothetical protein
MFRQRCRESSWALLKEQIGTRIWPDRATARAEVFAFIETSGSAPIGWPSRAVSATPRVTRRARALSPMSRPAARPTVRAMTFLIAPPSSQPATSVPV